MEKQSLSERDICTKFITPALLKSGWDLQLQIREEAPLTDGRLEIKGKKAKRGERKFADYLLYYKPHIPLAVIEVKKNSYALGAGMQQALAYSDLCDVPFVFSSNGDAFLFRDRTGDAQPIEQELPLNAFPSPAELWQRYRRWKKLDDAATYLVAQDYHSDSGGKIPRYYQLNAINRTVAAIAKGQQRVLLVMATGTGKTYTAFQIIWRLWKAGVKKRILFLADRNILVDQTKTNDFKPFGQALTKIKKRQIDKPYEIYLALYQAVSGSEEDKNIYKQFSPDFFDLIVIDECHRGSAREDSAWREILEYFNSATHVGLTATPKETKDVSNIDYFGEPVYTYTLKQGIEDGFLAPYKVVRIDLDKDLFGYRPESGKRDKYGQAVEDRIYNQRDFDRQLVLEQRTALVARKVTELLQATDRYGKTIVFCEDVDHAERMRQALTNANPDLVNENRKYVMRITGDDAEGKAELDHFIDPESRYPVVVTTSKLLNTGVDAQTCKLIVLDQTIQSMTEFKQIIGRGTRIREEYGKTHFIIMDFKKATELFADPDFDGEPVQVYEPGAGDPPLPAGDDDQDFDDNDLGSGEATPPAGQTKYVIHDVPVHVIAERVQYYSTDGRLITESLKDYTRKTVRKEYASLDQFLQTWTEHGQKKLIIAELEKLGVLWEALAAEVGKDFDAFDLICHVAFDQPPLTRRERADNVRKRDYFARYGDKARAVLEALLDKYAEEGIETVEDKAILKVPPLNRIGTPIEILRAFGGKTQFERAMREFQDRLYDARRLA